jgi:hypothetical protein
MWCGRRALEREGERRARCDCAPRQRLEAVRNVGTVDDGVAPVVEPHELGQELGAETVSFAGNRVDS